MQVAADLLGGSLAIYWRQTTNLFHDEPVVQREDLQANHTGHVEPGGVELL